MSIVENIRWLCGKHNTSIPKLEKEMRFGNGAIYNWDKSSPSIGKLQKVADYFNVSLDFINNGFDKEIISVIKSLAKTDNDRIYFPNDVLNELSKEIEPLKREYYDVPLDLEPVELIGLLEEFPVTTEFKEAFLNVLIKVKNIVFPNTLRKLDTSNFFVAPILGTIRGGPPTFAAEEIEGYMYVDPSTMHVSESDDVYYLRVKGDSMIPKYQPGDLVLIRKQPTVDNGEVAAVLIDGEEATLKKVHRVNGDILLYSTNPNYEPIKEPANNVVILGKAMVRVG